MWQMALSGSWLWCCFKIWEQLHYRPISSHTPRFLGETRKGRQSPGVPKRWAHRAETQVHRRLDQKSRKLLVPKSLKVLESKIFRCLLYFCRNSRPDPSWVIWHLITTRSFRRLLRPREVKFTSCKTGFEVTSESASTAENDAGLLGHPKNAKICQGWFNLVHFSVWSGPCFIQCFSPAFCRVLEGYSTVFRNDASEIFRNWTSYSKTGGHIQKLCRIQKLVSVVLRN